MEIAKESILVALGSFAVAVIIGPVIIPFLRKLKFGQTIREEGPETHLKKNGTPTMGGWIFLIAAIIPGVIFSIKYEELRPVLLLTLDMGFIGFLDDYIKVVLKRSMGLRAWQKFLLQIVVATVFYFYLRNTVGVDLSMKIPFWPEHYMDLGWLNIPLMFFVILGTDNGTNLTDGVDGLAATVTCVVAAFFCVAAISQGSAVAIFCAAMCGGLMGFLMFNLHPAKVFMGDTGSLALGGFVAGAAYMLKMPLFVVIVGIIYVIEALSVMLQVSYFKMTHGKRLFKMAPIHHHYEIKGWSETQVVGIFTAITILACLAALLGLW